MTTLGIMVDRIADELARADLNTQIATSVRSAVNHYAGERWFQNESVSFTICVSSATDTYALPTNFEAVDEYNLLLSSGTVIVNIDQQDFGVLSSWQTGTSTGQPTDFAIYEGKIVLYPAPDQNYTTVLSYVGALATLSVTTDTNFFVVEGEELIRSRARADIQINFLRDEGATAEYMLLAQIGLPFYSHRERAAYSSLRSRAVRRITTGRLRPSNW